MNPTFRGAAGAAASLLLMGLGACMSDLSVGVSEDLPDDEYGDTTGIRRDGSTQNTSRSDAGRASTADPLTPISGDDDGGLVSFPSTCTLKNCNATNGGATCSAVPTCGLFEGICQWKCEAVVTTIPNAPDNTGRGRNDPAPPDDSGSTTTPPATTPPATTPPVTRPPVTTPPATTPPPEDDGPGVVNVEPPKGSGALPPPSGDNPSDPVDTNPTTPPSGSDPSTGTPSGGTTSPTGSGALDPNTTGGAPAPGGAPTDTNPSVSARGTEDAGTAAPSNAADAGTPADAGSDASTADAGT